MGMYNKVHAWKLATHIARKWPVEIYENHMFHGNTAIGEGWPTLQVSGFLIDIFEVEGDDEDLIIQVTNRDGECEESRYAWFSPPKSVCDFLEPIIDVVPQWLRKQAE